MGRQSISQRIQGSVARGVMNLPAGMLRVLAGKPVVVDGQTLDVQTQLMLKLQRMQGLDGLGGGTPAAERRMIDAQSQLMAPGSTQPLAVDDIQVAGAAGPIAARVYRPRACKAAAPALLFYHGGGFVIGSLDSHDGVCRALADRAGCVVISVDYRLAPEHPAPAGVEDSIAAFRDIAGRAAELDIDASRIAVCGDSAGANLATVVAQATRNDKLKPCFQLLFYPTVDFSRDRESVRTFAEGFLLEKKSMDWFRGHYIPDDMSHDDPRVSPIYGDLAGLAPAHIITGGFDPLRDEGEAYGQALQAAGVTASIARKPSMIHGFLNFAGAIHGGLAGLTDGAQALSQQFEQ